MRLSEISGAEGGKPSPVPSLLYSPLTHRLLCLTVLQCTEKSVGRKKLKMALGIKECNAVEERELDVLAHD